jgi:lysophospholipase L1-like esterase
MRKRPVALVVALVALVFGTTGVSASSNQNDSPGHYYLALGDSLAYGFQQAKFNAQVASGQVHASAFNTGYVDDLAAMLRTVQAPISTVNYGCPGETTASYFVGCAWHAVQGLPLHNTYSGSQEAAALAFLSGHRRQVGLITLDNGANDISACLSSSDTACIPRALAQVATNLDRALGELRHGAPHAEIIVMQYYDPYAVAFPGTIPVILVLNQEIAAAAAAHGARLADTFAPINLAPPQPETLCRLTLFCTPLNDVHASDAGYAVIAQQFWAASSYSQQNQEN